MKRFSLFAGLMAGFSVCGAAVAADIGDVAPGVVNNKIVTGAFDDTISVYTPPNQTAFDFAFGGDDPLQPFFTEDPGFRSPDAEFPAGAVPFIPNSTLRFNILSDLLYSSDGATFGPVPAGTLLTLDKGSFSVTIGTGETLPKTGLLLGSSDASGIIHEHIGSTLSNDFGDPLPGFYRFEMRLLTDTAGIEPSDPFSITYELTPEPASLSLLAAGSCLLWRRRRNARRIG